MSDSDRDKKLDELLDMFKRAPAMNGGFAKLQDAVSNIQDANTKVLYELQLVKANQEVHTNKIDELHNALYNPDKGLYRRVTSALEVNDMQSLEITEVKERAEENTKKLDVFETKHTTLEAVAGEDLKELRSTISTRKNMMRAFWAFAIAALAGLAKFLWDTLPGLF